MGKKEKGEWPGYPFTSKVLLRVWHDSPDTGRRECLCSLCVNRIYEGETAIRMFGASMYRGGRVPNEMRFHQACFFIAQALLRGEAVIWRMPNGRKGNQSEG